jgi:LmbE family N-acetylglucosaminyl deacetylase
VWTLWGSPVESFRDGFTIPTRTQAIVKAMGPRAVILSPHFDDAVLSCWHVLTGVGEVLVVNVFASEPSAGTLGWWDRLAGASDSAAVVRARVEEDRQALVHAGCTAVNLPFLDGQYRELGQSPTEIVQALHGVLPAGARVYAPAGLGNRHRDHTAVLMAALTLRAQGAEVTLYADLPHATVRGWPRWVLDGSPSSGPDHAGEVWGSQLQSTGIPVEGMVPAVHPLGVKEHARKLEAVLSYTSQIASLQRTFGSSLEDPQLLGLEVEWRLALVA